MVDTYRSATRKSLIINLLKAAVFTSLLGLLFLYNMHRPRILILHSYDPTMDIVKDFERGVKISLGSEIEPLVQTYYMNMLNNGTASKRIAAGEDARAAIDAFKPKILIAVGDEAQEFAAKFYLGKEKPRILFAAIKGDFKNFGYQPGKNVGGIIETPQIKELNTLINSMGLAKQNLRLAHLGDMSTIVNLTEQTLAGHHWQGVQFIDSVRVNDISSFKKAAILLNKNCDILLVSSYRSLKNDLDEEIISDEIMSWIIANTSVPIISTFGYAVEEGAGAAIIASAYEQGILAMASALKMLKDQNYFPNLTSKFFAVCLNERHLHKHKLQLPGIYSSFAIATQKMFSSHNGNGDFL